jgi:hypothetical protein
MILSKKHLWIKKATGLGASEFFLRLMTWLCSEDDIYHNSQMCIVTGPNLDVAIKLIKRMKVLFEPHNIIFESKETVLESNVALLKYILLTTYAYRALDNILLYEADFFRKSEQEDASVMFQNSILQNQIQESKCE